MKWNQKLLRVWIDSILNCRYLSLSFLDKEISGAFVMTRLRMITSWKKWLENLQSSLQLCVKTLWHNYHNYLGVYICRSSLKKSIFYFPDFIVSGSSLTVLHILISLKKLTYLKSYIYYLVWQGSCLERTNYKYNLNLKLECAPLHSIKFNAGEKSVKRFLISSEESFLIRNGDILYYIIGWLLIYGWLYHRLAVIDIIL